MAKANWPSKGIGLKIGPTEAIWPGNGLARAVWPGKGHWPGNGHSFGLAKAIGPPKACCDQWLGRIGKWSAGGLANGRLEDWQMIRLPTAEWLLVWLGTMTKATGRIIVMAYIGLAGYNDQSYWSNYSYGLYRFGWVQ